MGEKRCRTYGTYVRREMIFWDGFWGVEICRVKLEDNEEIYGEFGVDKMTIVVVITNVMGMLINKLDKLLD